MKLGTHMPGVERRKPIDIEDCRTKVKGTTSKNRTNMWYFVRFRTISYEQNVGSKWNLVHTCLMVRGGSLLRFVGQKSRSHCPSTTRLSHLWCITDFLKNKITNKEEIEYKKSLNIDGQHFHQYKNQPSRTSNIWHKRTMPGLYVCTKYGGIIHAILQVCRHVAHIN